MKTDSFWKNVLTEFFEEFLQFFFPDIHTELDFTKGYQFLDKEFQEISRDSEAGLKIVDKLVRVFSFDGDEKWLLIHIEIQAQKEEDFAKRMYIYNYRIFDKYQRDVVSLALLTDQDPHYRPNEFQMGRWGCSVLFKFPLVKIIDYINYEFEKNENNPFALVVQAFLTTLETEGDNQRRYRWKRKFILRLYDLGFDRETLSRLYRFIEWIMELPRELDEQIFNKIKQIEEHKAMSIISIAEEKGIEKGMQKGEIIGLLQAIKALLEHKFGNEGKVVFSRLEKINSPESLKSLIIDLENSDSLSVFEKKLSEKGIL